MLITSAIPNLIGGVSQQPPSIRQANEAEEITNAVPSPVEGLIKRPPTEHIAAITDGSGNLLHNNLADIPFVHMIERDENEKYILVVQKNGTASVYDLAGNRKTLFVINSLSTAEHYQRFATTIADVTFISNYTETPALTAAVASQTPTNYNRAGLIWVKQANYARKHTVKLTSGATTSTFTHVTRSLEITNAGSSGTLATATYNNVQLTYVSGTKATTYPKATITVTSNKVSKVQITADAVSWNGPVSTKLSALPADINNINNFECEIKDIVSGEIGTALVAESLLDGETSGYIGPPGGIKSTSPYLSSTEVDGVISVVASADFTAVLEDDFAGEGMIFIRDEVERFEDLPPTAPHNYTVRVKNAPEAAVDDYYVKFKADNGVFSRGVWEETVAPGVKYEIDKSKMPLILIRQSDGTFMLKRADGVTPSVVNGRPTADSAQVYDAFKWADRLVGDEDTNPSPTFIGEPIKSIVYHQNRLGFLAGENIILSETGEFFNFWRTTVLDVPDSETIDVAASTPRIGQLVAAVPFNRDLILFTPTSQMLMRGNEVFSPRTVGIFPVADFESESSRVHPVPSANSVFFLYPNGLYYGMRELVPHQNIDGSYVANDLTAQVSRYIDSTAYKIAATSHDNIAVIATSNGLVGYRYANQGDQRVQSAWFKFTFDSAHDPAYADIAVPVWVGFNESDLYVVMHRTRNSTTAYMTIEKIRMGSGLNDTASTGKDWVMHLDQRTLVPSGSKSYSSVTGRTTITLPKPMSNSAGKIRVVNAEGYTLNVVAGTVFNISTGAAGTVQVNGDVTAVPVWVGTDYNMVYQFSTPYLKARAGGGSASIISGRYQLRNLFLQYADSGYFKATITLDDGTSYEYLYTGETLGLAVIGSANISTGVFKIPVYSRNDGMTLKITNDSPFPCKLLSADLEAYYNDRASRYST
jgi:hypothetical protein